MKLRVQQDMSQIVFSSVPAQRRPRHAFVPRWHFDMVQDQLRNNAYDQAITRVSKCDIVHQILSQHLRAILIIWHSFSCMQQPASRSNQGCRALLCEAHPLQDVMYVNRPANS